MNKIILPPLKSLRPVSSGSIKLADRKDEELKKVNLKKPARTVQNRILEGRNPLIYSLCQSYNSQNHHKEIGRHTSHVLLQILRNHNYSLKTLKESYEMKLSNTTWYKAEKITEFIPRKRNEKKFLFY